MQFWTLAFSSKWNLVSNLTNLFGEHTPRRTNWRITGVMRGESVWLDAKIAPQTVCRGLGVYLHKVMRYLHVWLWFSSVYWVLSLLNYILWKNSSRHLCSSFALFKECETYRWCLITDDLATSRTNQTAQLWPGNQSSQSQVPAVTLQPSRGTATCATMIISQQPPVTSPISACLRRSKNRL